MIYKERKIRKKILKKFEDEGFKVVEHKENKPSTYGLSQWYAMVDVREGKKCVELNALKGTVVVSALLHELVHIFDQKPCERLCRNVFGYNEEYRKEEFVALSTHRIMLRELEIDCEMFGDVWRCWQHDFPEPKVRQQLGPEIRRRLQLVREVVQDEQQ